MRQQSLSNLVLLLVPLPLIFGSCKLDLTKHNGLIFYSFEMEVQNMLLSGLRSLDSLYASRKDIHYFLYLENGKDIDLLVINTYKDLPREHYTIIKKSNRCTMLNNRKIPIVFETDLYNYELRKKYGEHIPYGGFYVEINKRENTIKKGFLL